MTMTSLALPRRPRPSLPTAAVVSCGTLGAAWNAFGLERFAATTFATREELVAQGLSTAQATLYVQLPGWMSAAFAIGVAGGLAGSVLMVMGRRAAVPILGVSLIAYLALFAGDWTHGVFDAFAGQLAMLSVVVAIAAVLLGAGVLAQRRGLLR